jgi:hypothetical protein
MIGRARTPEKSNDPSAYGGARHLYVVRVRHGRAHLRVRRVVLEVTHVISCVRVFELSDGQGARACADTLRAGCTCRQPNNARVSFSPLIFSCDGVRETSADMAGAGQRSEGEKGESREGSARQMGGSYV